MNQGTSAGRMPANVSVNARASVTAGFDDVSVEPWREYSLDDARTFLAAGGLDVDTLSSRVDGKIASAFIRATKPAPASCCAPGCCA